ncbi:MAG: hypothetical protein OQK82_03195, partial [Candidatus Pacearchaeota archaeon]|nr:hypothetical protein [Candidatus Pacearchaeota archaeon]
MKGEDIVWLNEMFTSESKLKKEHTEKKRPYGTISVKNTDLDKYLVNGWEIDRELKYKTRIKKDRNIDEALENRAWNLFYLMGYPEMNSGKNFKVRIERKGAKPISKQIDILAKDDETVIVAECKASNRVRKKSLQKDIEEFSNLKGPIANAIKKHYGSTFKPKIIWMFITHKRDADGHGQERDRRVDPEPAGGRVVQRAGLPQDRHPMAQTGRSRHRPEQRGSHQ